jgi:predicted nucleic acid-binding protein
VKVAVDTDRLTDLFRGDAALADLLGGCEEVWVPLVTLAELKAGFC